VEVSSDGKVLTLTREGNNVVYSFTDEGRCIVTSATGTQTLSDVINYDTSYFSLNDADDFVEINLDLQKMVVGRLIEVTTGTKIYCRNI